MKKRIHILTAIIDIRILHSGGLEQTAAALRLPDAVMAGTAWRQEKSCRLFAFLGPLWREWWLDWETGTQSQNPSKKWIIFLELSQ